MYREKKGFFWLEKKERGRKKETRGSSHRRRRYNLLRTSARPICHHCKGSFFGRKKSRVGHCRFGERTRVSFLFSLDARPLRAILLKLRETFKSRLRRRRIYCHLIPHGFISDIYYAPRDLGVITLSSRRMLSVFYVSDSIDKRCYFSPIMKHTENNRIARIK